MIVLEKVLFLRNVSLFSMMRSKELGRIASIAKEVVYPVGTRIITAGELGDCMYLIVEGEVRIFRDGTELAILREKDYFGEMSILDGEPRSASAEAKTNCLLLMIRQDDFHAILTRHIETSITIIKALSGRVRSMMG